MNGGPVAIRVFQASGDLIPVHRLIGLERVLRLRLHAESDAEIADVANRIALLGQDLGQRLTRILVVVGNIVIEIGLDGLEHGGPIRPFRRTVIANHVGRLGRLPGRDQRQR